MKRKAILYGRHVTVFDGGRIYTKSFSSKEKARDFREIVLEGEKPMEELLAIEEPLFDGSEYFITRGGETVYMTGTVTPVPKLLVETILDNQQYEESFRRFWTLCLLNPDRRVVDGIFDFIQHYGLSITNNGYFISFKGVRSRGDGSFTDTYTGKMHINIGVPVSMPREQCDSDPSVSCSLGLHLGSPEYVHKWLADTTLMCLVNPMNVVSVPYDYRSQKMRTCEYYPAAVVEGGDYNDMIKLSMSAIHDNNYLAYEIAKLSSLKDDQFTVEMSAPIFDNSEQSDIEAFRNIIDERRKYLV